jgi:hypothetical protein
VLRECMTSGSGSCPECDIPLRRTNFRLQLFEDAIIDKEVDIRRRILKAGAQIRISLGIFFSGFGTFGCRSKLFSDMVDLPWKFFFSGFELGCRSKLFSDMADLAWKFFVRDPEILGADSNSSLIWRISLGNFFCSGSGIFGCRSKLFSDMALEPSCGHYHTVLCILVHIFILPIWQFCLLLLLPYHVPGTGRNGCRV